MNKNAKVKKKPPTAWAKPELYAHHFNDSAQADTQIRSVLALTPAQAKAVRDANPFDSVKRRKTAKRKTSP